MRRVSKDPDKARALLEMARTIEERVAETDAERFPSQVLKDRFDALRCHLEALAALEGRKASGRGAHAQLIDWAAEEVDMTEGDRELLHRLRRHRNRIAYEGFSVDADFVDRNQERISRLLGRLQQEVRARME